MSSEPTKPRPCPSLLIEAQMLKLRITKRQLAKLASISPYRLNRILHSGVDPSVTECFSIARALKVSVYFLFTIEHIRQLPACSVVNVAV
jgi:transcriptional regulator with XRE-family HTH domain